MDVNELGYVRLGPRISRVGIQRTFFKAVNIETRLATIGAEEVNARLRRQRDFLLRCIVLFAFALSGGTGGLSEFRYFMMREANLPILRR
jgi:hypothetical protein